jgi:hypothetical protein
VSRLLESSAHLALAQFQVRASQHDDAERSEVLAVERVRV